MTTRSLRATISTTVAIVGGGQAGLAMSSCLSRRGISHVVLERGRIAERWRSERWDSLRLLTPNWMTRLPGFAYDGDDPQGFMAMPEVVGFFERYAATVNAPVIDETTVFSAVPTSDGYELATSSGSIRCRFLVAATGACATPWIPAVAARLPDRIFQTSPKYYKRPDQLPDGDVLVVGASASGVQLARELQISGRQVTLAVSAHTRIPRRYRGLDIHEWLDMMGTLDRAHDSFDDLDTARREPSLQLVGDAAGRSLGLDDLQRHGVRLAGRLTSVGDRSANFNGDLRRVVADADAAQTGLLDKIDRWVADRGLDAELDAVDRPDPVSVGAEVDALDLSGLESVVWATGYRPDFSWLSSPHVDRHGSVRHVGGVAEDGLYVLGLPLTRTRKSTFIDGVGADAEAHADHIARRLAGSRVAVSATVAA
jgi:putative flavoprotein involved in K+ transport